MPEPISEITRGITTTLQTDDEDNLVLEFPTEILEAMGWGEGDTLDIQVFAGRLVFAKIDSDAIPEQSQL